MFRNRVLLAAIAGAFSMVSVDAASANDLNGIWTCNDGTVNKFYVRQVGNDVWWYGESPVYSNVAYGKYNSGNLTVKVDWSDVPKNSAGLANGTLKLQVSYGSGTSATMTVLSQTGGFGATSCSRP